MSAPSNHPMGVADLPGAGSARSASKAAPTSKFRAGSSVISGTSQLPHNAYGCLSELLERYLKLRASWARARGAGATPVATTRNSMQRCGMDSSYAGSSGNQVTQVLGRTEQFDPGLFRLSEAFSNPHTFGRPTTR